MKRISLWSGPRNISTAIMYSFAQRHDTHVVDEPLYGHYLSETKVNHPGRKEIMSSLNCDGESVIRDLFDLKSKDQMNILFIKQMTKHLLGIDLSFLQKTENILLIRNPIDMLPSLAKQLHKPSLSDTGFDKQWELYQHLENIGSRPIILDATELLRNPKSILSTLCEHLNIEFLSTMLNWKTGPRKEDGIWAKYWYKSLHKTSGFNTYAPKSNFPVELNPLLIECKPYYEKLYKHSIKVETQENECS